MKCPFCGNIETQVKDSRQSEDGTNIRRRRFCPNCDGRFTTFERLQLRDISVEKSDGKIVPFDKEKLHKSIKLAVNKRNVSDEKIESIVNSIVKELEMSGQTSITSRNIGEKLMEELEKVDIVAYIRFASVYKNFSKKEDFNDFLDKIKNNIK
ncbi:MAG: transcriptional regulator NrdR [Alphaproteobacteria bacterium]|jgi:transcriptional repressor NrdR|nr:transcriptional regulator NrdR [Alphaproteobacteria bacterium]